MIGLPKKHESILKILYSVFGGVNTLKIKKRISFISNICFQIILVFLIYLPFYFMIISSFKTNDQILRNYFVLTFPLQFENYFRAFGKVMYYMLNSVIISGGTVVGVIILSCLAAYTFARFEFPGKKLLFILMLSFMMIPTVLTLIPQFVLIVGLGLNNTYFAAIFPYIAGGQIVFIFILRTFIEDIPKDLFDSAKIDGASDIRMFFHIVLPLAKPIIFSLALMNLLTTWNDFVWPLMVLPHEEMKTITVGLYSFMGEQSIRYGQLFAGFIIASIPFIILFALNMNSFIRGMTSGAIKG